MKLTIFNAKKSYNKFPASPYNDNTFEFETREAGISEIFESLTSNFTLNMPLNKKNIRTQRNLEYLKEYLPKMIDYIIIDIDKVKTLSDRELCIKYFRDKKLRVILAESRSPYNIKGVMVVDKMTIQQGKKVLKEIEKQVPGVMDASALNRASYQAPILKHIILLDQRDGINYPKPEEIINKIVLPKVTEDLVQNLCRDEFVKKGFSFNKATESGYVCSHSSEKKSPNGFSWDQNYPFKMGHWNPDRSASVWNEVIKRPEYKQFQLQESKLQVKKIIPINTGNINERYIGPQKEQVEEFLSSDKLLRVQSPMGTGKSALIEEVLHQASKQNLRVLFVTNRISLANDIVKKYSDGDLKHYNASDVEDEFYTIGDNLVVQLDSLYRYSIKYFDLVIVDEYTTTLTKLLSLEKNRAKITKQFFSLSKKKMVILDAFIFDETVSIFRPKDQVISITNSYRDDVDIEIYKQRDQFIFDLLEEAEKGPITFSCGSIVVLDVVEMLAKERGLSCKMITSTTTKKEAIYKTLSQPDAKWNIFGYSPTLTVGVSNENDIKVHYHYDSGSSMDVLSSLQMVKRTRKAQEIKMFLKERVQYQPTDLNVIQSRLVEYNKTDSDGDSIGLTFEGTKLSELIRIFNTLGNRHLVSFLGLMKLQFTNNIQVNDKKMKPFISKVSKIVKKYQLQEKLDIFQEYKTLDPGEISEIDMKLFGKTKREIYIKEFEKNRSYQKTLKLSDKDFDKLLQEEIKNPGTIECYQEILDKNFFEQVKGNNYKLSNNDYNKYKALDLDPKIFGYKKQRNIWIPNQVLVELEELEELEQKD